MPKITSPCPLCRTNCCDILVTTRYIRRAAAYNNSAIISPKYRQLLLSHAFGTVLGWSGNPVFVLHLISTSLFSAVGNLYRKRQEKKQARKSVSPLQTWLETRSINSNGTRKKEKKRKEGQTTTTSIDQDHKTGYRKNCRSVLTGENGLPGLSEVN